MRQNEGAPPRWPKVAQALRHVFEGGDQTKVEMMRKPFNYKVFSFAISFIFQT